jgi:hypothetical protein
MRNLWRCNAVSAGKSRSATGIAMTKREAHESAVARLDAEPPLFTTYQTGLAGNALTQSLYVPSG